MADLLVRFFAEEGFETPASDVRSRATPFIAEPANSAFLAYEGDAAVGVATLTTAFGIETGRYGEIEDLYVLPAHRRKGVARALVGAAIEDARSRGCRDVEVVVTPEGDAAHGLLRWYMDLGWRDTGRRILQRDL